MGSHVWDEWNITYHARWTPLSPGDPNYFVKENDCITVSGEYRQDACCGSYGAATHDVHQMSNAHQGKYPIKPYSRRPYASTNPTVAAKMLLFLIPPTKNAVFYQMITMLSTMIN